MQASAYNLYLYSLKKRIVRGRPVKEGSILFLIFQRGGEGGFFRAGHPALRIIRKDIGSALRFGISVSHGAASPA